MFSDVHGNLPALELMVEHAGRVEGFVCLGDCVNYGPWSDECVDLVRSLPGVIFLEGNHETYFLDGSYPGSNMVAKAFFEFCYPRFSRRDGIEGLATKHDLNGHVFEHTIGDAYFYPDSVVELASNHVIGHSHHQFELASGAYRLYNTGSVGQNRRYINVINYLLLDTDAMAFEPRAFRYDERVVINEMKRLGYPEICVDYYDHKQRL